MKPLIQTLNNGMSDKRDAYELSGVLSDVYNRFRSCCLQTATLAIVGAGNAGAKTTTASYYTVEGILRTIAASTNLPALTGINIAQNKVNVAVFTVDKAGTIRVQAGTAAATLPGVRFPELEPTRAVIGILIIAPTSAAFVGGTTALDGTAANTVYISPIGPFDPSATV